MNLEKYNTRVILDWDDTLFPTTWLLENNIDITNKYDVENFIKNFRTLDKILSGLLKKMSACGTIIIITNATTEWVQASSRLLPMSREIIKNIDIISARKHREKIKMKHWKKMVFYENFGKKILSNEVINIISVGDADYEYNALIGLYKFNNYKLLKSVRLKSSPTFEELIDQLSTLTKSIDSICKMKKHLDLKFV